MARGDRDDEAQRVAEPEPDAQPPERAARRAPEPTSRRRGALNFVHECWAELQRVTWPGRRELWQATGVVILVCIVIGVYLAVIDAGLTRASAWLVRQYANH